MKRIILLSTLAITVSLGIIIMTGCSNVNSYRNEAANIKQLVNDYNTRTLTADIVSVTSHQLIVTDEGSKKTFNLPEDEFYVSIAPYVNQTHPCAYHNISSCQGEMVNEEFEVYIEDEEGNVLIDEIMKSQPNGFIDFWLPRNKTYTVTINKGEKSAQAEFSTFQDDHTCITTIQLI